MCGLAEFVGGFTLATFRLGEGFARTFELGFCFSTCARRRYESLTLAIFRVKECSAPLRADLSFSSLTSACDSLDSFDCEVGTARGDWKLVRRLSSARRLIDIFLGSKHRGPLLSPSVNCNFSEIHIS